MYKQLNKENKINDHTWHFFKWKGHYCSWRADMSVLPPYYTPYEKNMKFYAKELVMLTFVCHTQRHHRPQLYFHESYLTFQGYLLEFVLVRSISHLL